MKFVVSSSASLVVLGMCAMVVAVFGSAQTYPITSRIAGTGVSGSTNGDALTTATMNGPSFLAADMIGNLYITSTSRHVIRFYNAELETLTTVIGQSGSAGSGEGTGTAARLNAPTGITVERKSNNQGRVFICDRDNRRIRVYDPVSKVVSTFAGSGSSTKLDGTGTAAGFNTLQDITAGISYLYVAEAQGTEGFIRRIDMTSKVVTTIYTNPSRGVASVAFNPLSPTELYFAIVGNIFAINLSTLAVRTVKTFAFECSGMSLLPNGLLAYTCPTSTKHAVYFIYPNGTETVLGQSDTSGYVEGATSPTGVLFNKPTGITVASASSEYARYAVADTLNNRVRLIQVAHVGTITSVPTPTASLEISKTRSFTIPIVTTTTAAPTTTTTTVATTTTTAAPTTTAVPTTTPTPTFVPAFNTSFIEFRFPASALPISNSTQMMNVMVRMEADILTTLGASSSSTEGVYIIPEYTIINTTDEVIFRVQVPNGQVSTSTIQAIALTSWPITTAYLQATQSSLDVLCTSCSGSNCNVTSRPRCASENNNGLVIVTFVETFQCEEVWCILTVFLGCLVAGILIAGAAFYASTSTSYQRFQSNTKAIREEL